MSTRRTPLKFLEETDPGRIVQFNESKTAAQLLLYFKQRLGHEVKDLPGFPVDREFFLQLVGSSPDEMAGGAPAADQLKRALLCDLIIKDPEAADEIRPFFLANDREHRVYFTMSIETPTVGDRAVDFFKHCARDNDEFLFTRALAQLAAICQKHHAEWKARGLKYQRVLLPWNENAPDPEDGIWDDEG